MAIAKNRGPKLITKIRGGADDFPKEFLAFVGLDITSQKVPTDVSPSPIAGLLIESRLEQELTDERKLVDTFLTEFPTTSLSSEVMLPSGLVAQRSRKLVPDPTDVVANVLTESADQRNLGNGWLDQVIVEAPELFHEQLFARERQVLGAIPAEFRAGITQLTTSEVVEGTATDPGPLTGTQEYSLEQQLTVFKKKVEQRGLDISVIGELINYKMTPDQQLESLIVSLTDVEPSPSSFTATTVESEIKALGGGLWLVTEGTVPDVFPQPTFARERSILGAIPAEFRVGISQLTTSSVLAGTAADPGPLTGATEFSSEQQLTEFKKKIEQRDLDFSVLGTLTNYKMTPDQQLESLTVELTDVEPTPSVFSALTVESDIKALGGDLWLITEGTVPDVFRKDVFTRERSILGAIPAEFRVGIQTLTTSHEEAGTAADPGALTGTVEFASEQQTTEFKKKVEQRELDVSALGSLTNYKMTPDKQLESITVELTDVEPSPASFSALTVESEIKSLGGGLWLVTEGTVPDVFDHHVYAKERPSVIPQDFAALLQTTEEEFTEPGIAGFPTLVDGDLRRSQQQVDEFTRRVTVRSRPNTTGSIQSRRTNQFKQFETIVRILEDSSVTPTAPTAVMDVVYTRLGDGNALEERTSVPSVFRNVRYALEIPDVIPPEFRALVPAITTTETLEGNAAPPTPGDPTLTAASDEQVTVFTHRRSGTTRAIPTGITSFTGHETTSEFGGGVLDVIRTLSTTADIPAATGMFVVSSMSRPLGNGMFYGETKELATSSRPWPTLVSRKYDEELQSFTIEETQIVDRTYVPQTGTNFIENVRGIDKWRSQRIRVTKAPVATSEASAIVTYEYRPFQFPGTLNYARLIQYDHREGFRKTTAMLVRHRIKTWWQVSATTPDILIDGEIIMDTVNIPIFRTGDTSDAQVYPSVLHDEFTNTLGAFYPATTPTFTQYMLGTQTGTQLINFATMFTPGTGYHVGQQVTIADNSGHAMLIRVTAVGISNSILAFEQLTPGNWPAGTWGPFPPSGPPSAAQFFIVGVTIPIYDPSTKWVGNEKTIAASVKKTDIPNLWKIQKVSVVMR